MLRICLIYNTCVFVFWYQKTTFEMYINPFVYIRVINKPELIMNLTG